MRENKTRLEGFGMSYSAILIDDEIWTRNVLRSLGKWSELGIEIIAEASDGEYGRELITQLCPDIIITDVKMPHLNGIELITQLRGQGNKAKVIFVSGYDDYEFIRSAMKLQVVDYLLKPLKSVELNEQLQRCVEELDREAGGPAQQYFSLSGFLNVDWINDYSLLRNSIYEALHADDVSVVRTMFMKLADFLKEQLKHSFSKSLMICLYFDLHHCLQRHIRESGYTLNQIFDSAPQPFVFGQDFTLESMLHYVEELYAAAFSNLQKLVRAQGRIDVQKIRQYVDINYLEGITLESTAARFYISKEYLSKVFKQEHGQSFSDYVTELKMNKAKELLISNQVPIKEITQLTGYSDQAHFYKAFKRYHRMTPGEMLRKIKN